MSSDISRLSRDLPDPEPPADLEQAVRTMLASSQPGPHSGRRIRTSLLAVPAVAALIVLAMSVSPLSSQRTPRMQDTPTLAQSYVPAKGGANRESSKSTVRTAPLSTYSRQASLISF